MAVARLLGVILYCFLACELAWCGSRKYDIEECAEVRETFVNREIGPASMVPHSRIHDHNMDICYHGVTHPNHKSCCTRDMEHKFHQAMERDFSQALQSTSAYLKNLLHTNTLHYQDKFVSMITLAESNTDALFHEVYKIPLLERRDPLQNLFLDLRAYIGKLNVTVDVQDSVTEFFDEIFPFVFRHILNNLGDKQLSEDYKLCLMEVHKKELHKQPFGEFPKRLAHSLSKSLGSARDFLQAVSLAVEVIDKTDHHKLEHRCSKALTKLEFCGQCQGYADVRPCKQYCHNVMRGCLSHISTLDPVWNRFTDTLDAMTSNMRGTYSIEAVMRTFHMHISDAIMNALDAGPKFYPKIIEKCGHPQGQSKEVADHAATRNKPNAANFRPFWDPQMPDLHTKLSVFMRILVSSKGFYKSLPDTLCTAEKFSVGSAQQCWNGDGEGIYNKTVIAADDLQAQITSNPEFKVTEVTPEVIISLKDKLVKMTEHLNNRIISEMAYQSDDWSAGYDQQGYQTGGSTSDRGGGYYGRYDYGSGHSYHGYYSNDDEDYDFSGSGSGDHDYDDEGRAPVRTGPKRPGSQHNPDSDDLGFNDDNPYITDRPPGGASHQGNGNSPGGAAAYVRPYSTLLSVLTLVCIVMWGWRNG